jgi:Divergent AAA domain.
MRGVAMGNISLSNKKPSEIPLGKKEDQKLEFKSRDVLEELSAVGKGVVGMLNANGGVLWIGITDEDSQAVKVEPIEDIDSAIRKVRDHLIDAIEPPPTEDELKMESVDKIIKITVKPNKKRKPYAQLKGGGRFFVVRVGDRLRPMARQEIADDFINSGEKESKEKEKFRKEWEKLLQNKPSGLWMLVKPLTEIKIDIQNEQLKKLLHDATLTGNRPMGWRFTNPYAEIQLKQGRLILGEIEKGHLVELHDNGAIVFFTKIDRFHRVGPDNLFDPFPLMEFPVSICRLAKVLYQDKLENDAQLIINLALIGIKGWMLRPGSPDSIWLDEMGKHVFQDGDDFILSEPRKYTWEEVSDNPDYCGLRLVKSIYEAFGLYEKDMPAEYDRKNGRLVFGS